MNTIISVHADELRPGDLLEYGGRARRITAIVRDSGWSWPIALDGTGWAIALDRHLVAVSRTEVARRRATPHRPVCPHAS